MPAEEPPPETADEARRRALDAALHFLAARARSCQEVRRFLRKSGFDAGVTAEAEQRLIELGLLDDLAVARAVVEEIVLRRHEAPLKAEAALLERGVDPIQIAEALAAIDRADAGESGDAAFERALEAATARLRVLHGPEPSVRRRLWGYLARRGYDADVIEQVCARVRAGNRDEEPVGEESAKAGNPGGRVR